MKNHVTVVPEDTLIIVDNEALFFSFTASEDIHAIQWHEGQGWVEYKGSVPNKDAVYASDVEPFVLLWENEKARLEEEKAKPLPLDVLKQNTIDAINTLRDTKEQDFFIYDNSKFDSDPNSTQRLTIAAQSAATATVAGVPWQVEWTLYDNTIRILSNVEIHKVVDALALWGGYVHTYAGQLKNAVNVATTTQEVDAIDITTGWPTPEQVAQASNLI